MIIYTEFLKRCRSLQPRQVSNLQSPDSSLGALQTTCSYKHAMYCFTVLNYNVYILGTRVCAFTAVI